MHLDFRQLRNFVALVEYGSSNRAAESAAPRQSVVRVASGQPYSIQ